MPQMEQQTNQPTRDAGLDGLRGIAAVSVLLFHVWLFNDAHTTTRRDGLIDYVFVELKLGLYMFFALSGFLLVRPFIRAALDRRPMPQLMPYARNRLVRLAPGYWASLLGAAALLFLAGESAARHLPAAEDAWLFAVFGQGFSADTIMQLNPAAWSLPVELSFYALVPLIGAAALYFARRAGGPTPVIATIGALAALMIAIGLYWNHATIGENAAFRLALPGMLPYFALGMLAAMFAATYERGRTADARRLAPALLFGTGLLVLAAGIYNYERDIYADSLQVVRDIPAATGFALMIAGVATAGPLSAITKSFSLKPLVALGTVSYGIYLWHVPLLLAMRGELLPEGTLMASAIVLAASIVLGTLSWKLIEQPAIAWSRRTEAPKPERVRTGRPMRHPAIQPRLESELAGTMPAVSSANLQLAPSATFETRARRVTVGRARRNRAHAPMRLLQELPGRPR